MAQKQCKTKDPITKSPLRDPGQSLRNEINRLVDDKISIWAVWFTLAIALASYGWYRWMFDLPNTPVLFTVLAAVTASVCVWRLVSLRSQLRNLHLGLKGERWLGQFLQNSLLREGYWVVHDICDDDFNIDHALIGPTGVYAIETKTRSKPPGDVRVKYDGDKVLVNGWEPDRDPVAQARASAKRLSEILQEYSGREVAVRSVVIFPNWYVDGPDRPTKTWVLNEKAFIKFLGNEAKCLDATEVYQLAEALGRYVRDREDKAA